MGPPRDKRYHKWVWCKACGRECHPTTACRTDPRLKPNASERLLLQARQVRFGLKPDPVDWRVSAQTKHSFSKTDRREGAIRTVVGFIAPFWGNSRHSSSEVKAGAVVILAAPLGTYRTQPKAPHSRPAVDAASAASVRYGSQTSSFTNRHCAKPPARTANHRAMRGIKQTGSSKWRKCLMLSLKKPTMPSKRRHSSAQIMRIFPAC